MNILLPILFFTALALFVAWHKGWIFKRKAAPSDTQTSRTQAVINTLIHQTPSVPGVFPAVLSQAPLADDMKQGIPRLADKIKIYSTNEI